MNLEATYIAAFSFGPEFKLKLELRLAISPTDMDNGHNLGLAISPPDMKISPRSYFLVQT